MPEGTLLETHCVDALVHVDGVFSGHYLVDGRRPFFSPPLASPFPQDEAGQSSLWPLLMFPFITGLGCASLWFSSCNLYLVGIDLLGSISLCFSSNLEKFWPSFPHLFPHNLLFGTLLWVCPATRVVAQPADAL